MSFEDLKSPTLEELNLIHLRARNGLRVTQNSAPESFVSPEQEMRERVRQSVVSFYGFVDVGGKEIRFYVGSGFFLQDGRIMTARHVALSGVKRLEIETGQGSVLQIERSYVDPRIADQHATDFATFRPVVEAGAILPAGLALATAAQEGQKIFAFGRPLHEHQPVVGNEGSVSAPPPSSDGMGKRSLTHTAKVNHGMSGGPIVDERGDVIGIVAGGDSDPGIGYVTNDVYVDEFRTLVEHGQVFEEIQVSMKIIDLMADARKLTGAGPVALFKQLILPVLVQRFGAYCENRGYDSAEMTTVQSRVFRDGGIQETIKSGIGRGPFVTKEDMLEINNMASAAFGLELYSQSEIDAANSEQDLAEKLGVGNR